MASVCVGMDVREISMGIHTHTHTHVCIIAATAAVLLNIVLRTNEFVHYVCSVEWGSEW